MLTSEAITGLRQYLMDRIASARFTVNGREETVAIASKSIVSDGRISIAVILNTVESAEELITDISLYDADGIMLAWKEEHITQEPSMGGIYYRFFFLIDETV